MEYAYTMALRNDKELYGWGGGDFSMFLCGYLTSPVRTEWVYKRI